MRRSTDTILRQWTLLKRVPRAPQRRSTRELRDYLKAEGMPVDIRTVQRDLEQLSGIFPLASEAEGRTNYWYWSSADKVLEIPAMGPDTALTFRLAHDYLEALFPRVTLGTLAPYFARADEVLAATNLGPWRKKVRAIVRGPMLIPPKIPADVQSVVYQALLEDRRFEVDYRSREQKKTGRYEVNPLGLVVRAGVVYLVCTLWDYQDIRQLALHRMSRPRLLDERSSRRQGFDLKRYIEDEHGFAYPGTLRPIRLRALFTEDAAFHLYETPLSPDQRLTAQPDGRVLLTASVPDTEELRWWLLGFGDGVEVLTPVRLRSAVAKAVAISAGRYR